VLKGIDLFVKSGQVVSIIGPSGSGKSTVLRCMTGLVRPQQGYIRIGDTLVHKLHSEREFSALRAHVGFVFQQYNLFPHLTVLQNLILSPVRVLGLSKAEATERAHALLSKVHMEQRVAAYPGELSGGQQQRVAIARALAMQPELVLFDEVTSALDPEMVGEVLNVIRDLVHEGMTCVLVTHEMRFAEEVSDRIYFTEAGRIVEHGSPDRIFQKPQNPRTAAFLRRSLGRDVDTASRFDSVCVETEIKAE
jgi:polar amino acid transport system ATP-binding protein